ncbi:MAG: YajQ family cyclic di-GMP-binding protein [Nitrosomonadaceae bacterium]|nr:YajQ family cyclic di-GMP-binding protein [Nitrosomonadaceae bacterium]|tara:strand:+ start:276 stop:761 length:486 start_codon:yes stop_codon:yes gene_type:complete
MPSFDIVSEVDKQELKNAVDQVNKEIGTRFDFKGSDARIDQEDYKLTIYADDLFKIGQILDVLMNKATKRGVDVRCMNKNEAEKTTGSKMKQVVIVKTGVDMDLAKKIVKNIKDSKLKAQANIQGETIRVSGKKRDVLQEAIALLKKSITEFPIQFQNFRD